MQINFYIESTYTISSIGPIGIPTRYYLGIQRFVQIPFLQISCKIQFLSLISRELPHNALAVGKHCISVIVKHPSQIQEKRSLFNVLNTLYLIKKKRV